MDPAQLALTPAGKPPPGVIPNHVNPHSNGPTLIAVGSVFIALMLVCVTVRGYTKFKVVGQSTPDDWTCFFAALGAILYFALDVVAVTNGHWGTHMWDLTLADISSNAFLVTGYLANWTWFLFIMFAKLTFFLLYIQLFRPMLWLRYSSYAGATFTVLFYSGLIIFTLACTTPDPNETWQHVAQSSRQQKVLRPTVGLASVGLVLDIFILILPVAGVSRLQLSRKRKIGVMAVFLTGFIACIASSLGVYYKWRLDYQDSADLSYATMPVLLTGLVECCVGVIASCMPSIARLSRHINWERLASGLLSTLSSRFASSKGKSFASDQSGSQSKRARYADLEDKNLRPSLQSYEIGPVKMMRTYVRAGKTDPVEEDGIHLRYDVEQETAVKQSDTPEP